MQEVGTSVSRISSIKRKAISSSDELVTIRPLFEDGLPPLIVESALEPLDLAAWSANNLPLVRESLYKYGGILFRGFAGECQETLRKFTVAIGMQVMSYVEGATPRKSLGTGVYTSTEFPPEHPIALHNEVSYVMTWPMTICFACAIAPEDRGETPIADVRQVLKRIAPAIRKKFETKGYMLRRNFSEHLSLSWRTSFNVSTREELELYCRNARIETKWKDEEHLTTRQVRPATSTHPHTHEEVWFNHIAFWHVSSLDPGIREILVSTFGEDGLPYNTYYGDGSPIESEVVEELRCAYDAETVKFPWRRGDVLLLDNMLAAHGRSPFSGPRKVIVSMGEPFTRTDL